MAGEIGHLTIDPDAEDQCGCGKKGCLEAIASSPNIVRQYCERTGHRRQMRALRVTDVFERARSKDAAALTVVERAGRAIGIALSHAVNLLNPEIVILGGDLAAGEDLLLPAIQAQLARHVLPELMEGLRITTSGLGLDMRLRGAGALAFRKTLADPALLKKLCSPVLVQEIGARRAKRKVLA
jgi:predicted NBD/HSP70 family sugar kinase